MYFEFQLFCIRMPIYDLWFPCWAQQMLGRECLRFSHFPDEGMAPNPHSQYLASLHLCLWQSTNKNVWSAVPKPRLLTVLSAKYLLFFKTLHSSPLDSLVKREGEPLPNPPNNSAPLNQVIALKVCPCVFIPHL